MISDDKLYYAEEYEQEDEDAKKVKREISQHFYVCFIIVHTYMHLIFERETQALYKHFFK